MAEIGGGWTRTMVCPACWWSASKRMPWYWRDDDPHDRYHDGPHECARCGKRLELVVNRYPLIEVPARTGWPRAALDAVGDAGEEPAQGDSE